MSFPTLHLAYFDYLVIWLFSFIWFIDYLFMLLFALCFAVFLAFSFVRLVFECVFECVWICISCFITYITACVFVFAYSFTHIQAPLPVPLQAGPGKDRQHGHGPLADSHHLPDGGLRRCVPRDQVWPGGLPLHRPHGKGSQEGHTAPLRSRVMGQGNGSPSKCMPEMGWTRLF